VEKNGYGVTGGYFTDVMLHSSINYHQEHTYPTAIRTLQGLSADRCTVDKFNCNDMQVVGITGATREL
jgi:hypothetical protein